MYQIYARTRSYVYLLLFAKVGVDRLKYFSSFVVTPTDSILDLGCDKGTLFEFIKNPNELSLMTGVDIAKNKSKKYCHVTADAAKLPFKSSSFSLVTAFSSIEHIHENERFLLYTEVRRVIKEKGEFLVQLPNRYAIIESHTFLPFFGFLPPRMHQFAFSEKILYVSVPSLKEVLRSLKENDFIVTSVEKYNAPFLPFGRFFEKVGLFRIFPMGYIIRARTEHTRNKPSNK